jgi:hypothetical protein
MQKFVDKLKKFDDNKFTHLYSLQILTLMCRNRTMCNHLISETDFLKTLMELLHRNIKSDTQLELQHRAELQLISAALRAISRVESTHAAILEELSTIDLAIRYNNTSVNANLAEMYSNLVPHVNDQAFSTTVKLLNSIFPLTESNNTLTRNLSLKCLEILAARETNDQISEKMAIESLQKYLNKYKTATFTSTTLNYATVGLIYGLARFAVRGLQITAGRGGFPFAAVIQGALKTAAVVTILGSSFTAIDYISYYFDTKPLQKQVNFEDDALLLEAATSSYYFVFPILVVYLMHKVPFILFPLILGRSMTMSQPYGLLMPDESAQMRKNLKQFIKVERIK